MSAPDSEELDRRIQAAVEARLASALSRVDGYHAMFSSVQHDLQNVRHSRLVATRPRDAWRRDGPARDCGGLICLADFIVHFGWPRRRDFAQLRATINVSPAAIAGESISVNGQSITCDRADFGWWADQAIAASLLRTIPAAADAELVNAEQCATASLAQTPAHARYTPVRALAPTYRALLGRHALAHVASVFSAPVGERLIW